ncbi:hypothetical protein RUND412_008757 [Rhizina undulata]
MSQFSASSQDIQLINGHILKAKCRRPNGEWVWSELDLDRCIGNLNGFLAWDYENFSHSGHDAHLVNGGTKLDVYIKKADGGERELQGINLNDRIGNEDGRLVFHRSK